MTANRTRRWLIIVPVAMFSFAVAGCGNSVTKGPDGNVVVKRKGGKTEVSTGSIGVKLPKDFAKDIPIYPGSKVDLVSQNRVMNIVVLLSSDPPKQVYDYYNKQLAANEWQINSATETEKGGAILTRKDNRACNVSINIKRRSSETSVNITLQELPKE